MFTAKEFVKVKSLEEAWELNQRRSNKIVGGMMWLKMSSSHLNKIIDLSGLGLDCVEETPDEFRIGCMTTLRQLELHPGLDACFQGSIREALRSIVGVQFRNLATVGGSVFGRYGFSDVISIFMALDARVELYKGGIVPLSEFVNMKYDNDILVRLIVRKSPLACLYYSVRNTRTDFPLLTCAAVSDGETLRLAIGARPGKAMLFERPLSQIMAGQDGQDEKNGKDGKDGSLCPESIEKFAEKFATEAAKAIPTGSNLRAGSEYRTHLVKVLAKRAFCDLGGVKK